MNSFNFHGSKPSPSDGAGLADASAADARVFQDSYRFELTDEFNSNFREPQHLSLPSSFNLPYWEANYGDPARSAEARRVAELNVIDNERDRILRIDLEAKNSRRLEVNELRRRRHRRAVRDYLTDLDEFNEKEVKREQDRQLAIAAGVNDAIGRYRYALEGAIEDSYGVKESIDHARLVADQEKSNSGLSRAILVVLGIGWLTLPTMIGPTICGCLAYILRTANKHNHRRRFAELLTYYNTTSKDVDALGRRNLFLLRDCSEGKEWEKRVVSPVQLAENLLPGSQPSRFAREQDPLGHYDPDAFASDPGAAAAWFGALAVMSLPGIGLIIMSLLTLSGSDDLKQLADRVWLNRGMKRRDSLRGMLEAELSRPDIIEELTRRVANALPVVEANQPPEPPERPKLKRLIPEPAELRLHKPHKIEPPDWCFDTSEHDDFSYILKGAKLYSRQHIHTLAKYKVYEGDCVSPYLMFGGVPISLAERAPHTLVLGTSGSGKTTNILKLASALLPLTSRQSEEIRRRPNGGARRLPQSCDEWMRSYTHQAVVYNAKGEYLNHLKAFGFDQDIDLFNFDPADPKCYAWNVSADVDDADSITQFAEQLIPRAASSKQHDGYEMWLSNARAAVEAVIVSLRNAARAQNKPPAWNLRDLVRAFATKEILKQVLQWHDIPQEKISRYFDLASAQQSSIFVTLWEAIDKFTIIANRWHEAQERGRAISLKDWAQHGSHTVLVLPNTRHNVDRYGPLNATLLKSITSTVLQHRYSYYRDESGSQRVLRREFFFDELGQAGRLHDLERLMSEGRSFGVNVTIGVHQLSQLQETYGEHVAETILGLCSNRAFLRTDDQKTAEWMSKYVGNCLRSYDKQTFSYGLQNGSTFSVSKQHTSGRSSGGSAAKTSGSTVGTSDTDTDTINESRTKVQGRSSTPGKPPTSTSSDSKSDGSAKSHAHTESETQTKSETDSTNWQQNDSRTSGSTFGGSKTKSETTSNSTELRGEAAIEPHVFVTFPYPESDGVCEGVFRVPTLPFWRATLSADEMAPCYEFTERLSDWPATRTIEEDERVSKSIAWSEADLERLGLGSSPMFANASSEVVDTARMPKSNTQVVPPAQQHLPYNPREEVGEANSQRDDPLDGDFGF